MRCNPSVVGFLVFMCGGLIDWGTSIVKVTCLSSQHAEIGAAYRCCKAIKYIRQLATDMGMAMTVPMTVFIDSSPAIDHSKNIGTSKRTFHLERWEYFFRQCTQRLWIKPHWVGTKFQLADAMTKVIDATHFLIFRDFVLVVINDEMIVALKRKSD